MCHHDRRAVRTLERIHALGHDAQCIDVETGVGFVEDRQRRLQHSHLQDLIALLLTTREARVHRAVQHGNVHVDQLELLFDQIEELHRVDFFVPVGLAHFVVGGTQEVRIGHARDLDRILKREEHAALGAHFGVHLQEIFALVEHFATGDLVRRMAGQNLRQRALA